MRKPTFSLIAVLPLLLILYAEGADARVIWENEVISRDTVKRLNNIEIVSGKSARAVRSTTPFHEINRKMMTVTGVSDISDALRRVPGVNIRDYGGAGGLKTVSIRGLGAQHTSVVYDGVALTDCQTGQIDLSRYSLENMNRLAVYSGDNDDIFIPARASASASSLYISSWAMSGLSAEDPVLRLQLKGGSFGYVNPYLRFARKFSDVVAMTGNIDYAHAKNDYPFTLKNVNLITKERRENSMMNTWHAEMNWRFSLHNGGKINTKIYYYDSSRRLPGAVKYYVSASHEKLKDRNFFSQLQFLKTLNPVLTLSATGKFNWASTRYTDENGKYPNGLKNDYYVQREAYATGSLLWQPTETWSFNYSSDGVWATLSQFTGKSVNPRRLSLLQTIAAKYSTTRISVVGRLLFSEFFNYSSGEESSRDESKLSPMVSVSIRPFEDHQFFVRASYKNIFRVPTFNEAYFDNYGSLNLRPETTDQLNLGLTFRKTAGRLNDFNLTLDSYLNHVRNKIVAVPYNMFVWTMSNVGKVRTFGIDLGMNMEIDLGEGHQGVVAASYSYQDCKNRTSRGSVEWMKQVAYTPANTGSASISWLNPWVNAALSMTSMGKRFTNNTNIKETEISGFTDFGFSVFKELRLKGCIMNVRGEILNIFNSQYEIIARYPMPGRSWRLTAQFDI